MYTSIAPTATTAITKIAVGKTMPSMTTLPSLSWLGHKLTLEILAFGAKALFDYATKVIKCPSASRQWHCRHVAG
jgi:hypothetical protein